MLNEILNKENQNFIKCDFLLRPRIQNLLEVALQKKLTIIIAGSGYGKTQSVRLYLERIDNAVVRWVQLSNLDNQPSHHWENLIHSITKDNNRLAEILREFGFPESTTRFNQFLTMLKKYETKHNPIYFVLDDFHLINSPQIIEFAQKCINIPNENLHIVIMTRTEPNIYTVGMMAKNEMSLITEEDLLFNASEVEMLLDMNRVFSPQISISMILENTLGWAIALNMLMFVLKRSKHSSISALEIMKNNIFDLFENEAWLTLEDDEQKKLVTLSLFKNIPMDSLKFEESDLKILLNIPAVSAFIWYNNFTKDIKIHPLYIEFLETKQDILSRDEKFQLIKKVAIWSFENGFHMEAARFYIQLKDFEALLKLFYTYPFKLNRDISSYFLKLINEIELTDETNDFNLIFIKCYFVPLFMVGIGLCEEAFIYVNNVITKYENRSDVFANLILSTAYSNLTFIEMHLCTVTHQYLGPEYLAQSIKYSSLMPPPEVSLDGAFVNASVHAFACLVGSGASLLNFENYILASQKTTPLIAQTRYKIYSGYEYLVACEVAFYEFNLTEARINAYKAISLANEFNQFNIVAFAEFYLLLICIHESEVELAKEITTKLESYLNHPHFWNFQLDYDLYISYFYLQLGITELVPLWLKTSLKDSTNLPIRELITIANYHNVSKNYHFTLALFAFDYNRLPHERLLFAEIKISLAKAVAKFYTEDLSGATQDFIDAYFHSFQGKFELFFIELGRDFSILAQETKLKYPNILNEEWIFDIEKKASIYSKKLKIFVRGFVDKKYVKPNYSLTNREKEILNDMYQGLSREEIATNRHISVNTVKKILQSIYNKFDVNSNIDAIRIAIENQII